MGCGSSKGAANVVRGNETWERKGDTGGGQEGRTGGRERGQDGSGGARLRIHHLAAGRFRHVQQGTNGSQEQTLQGSQKTKEKVRGQGTQGNDANSDVTFSMLAGDVTMECPPSDKVVRIFLSSTFTDTSHERNTLMERVYPRLKGWCQERGYQFQVVDMRWGVRDEATDDHRTTVLCLHEIDVCTRISTGPCFVTLLSHKYGYRSFPTVFETEEFQTILAAIPSEEVKQLLTKWFKKDDNSVPPTHVLQPISSQLPNFLSNDKDLRAEAANQWWDESAAMQSSIGQAAMACLGNERAHTMMQSVTEAEIRRGMLAEESLLQRSVWLYRQIDDIDSIENSRLSSRFKDGRGDKAMQKESKTLLEKLKTELAERIAPEHLFHYHVQWDPDTGVNPQKDPSHKEYISNFCNDFEREVRRLAQEAIEAREQEHRVNALVEEVAQHTRLCQEKCRHFHGRQDALKRTLAYLQGKDQSGDRVFVIHGKSGSGKTSIVAMAAQQACQEHQGKGVVVLRFLGTSADSTSLVSLLHSVLRQLTAVKSRSLAKEDLPTNVKELSSLLLETLREKASRRFPVTLLLDSLDQMDPGQNARQLTWLPARLPDHVRVIVSTLPEAQYEAFPVLQARYEDDTSNFYEVPTLQDNDVSGILDQWLSAAQRQLTANQRELVLKAFSASPLPLFLKLSFDAAWQWKSYSPPATTVLQSTVRDSINVVFAEVERKHGKTLVSHTLAYLTLSRGGLTEAELEDILSCDDDVLNDVYMYWTPPVRRLPPLLLVRLKSDLGQYLVDRGADGVGVFFWYHRQFVEAARDRYCSDVNLRLTFHRALADYFCGSWSQGKPKPYTDKKGNSSQADRIVSSQPFMFGDSFNLRKLNNLPFHALQAGNIELLKTECLLNFQFLQAKLLASGIRAVLEDFSTTRKVLEEEGKTEEDVKMVAETLQLSQDALQYDPLQLPAQLLSRITSPSQGLKPFLQQCGTGSDAPFLLPNQPIMTVPGGQLVHSLNEHTSDVTSLALTRDGKFVVSGSHDQSLCVIDVAEGRRTRKIEGVGEECQQIFLCCQDSIIVADGTDMMTAFEFSTGVRLWSKETNGGDTLMAACGRGRSLLVAFNLHDGASVLEPETGEELKQLPLPEEAEDINAPLPISSSRRYVVTTNTDGDQILLLDVLKNKFRLSEKMERPALFPCSGGDDDDDDDDDFRIQGLVLSPDGKLIFCVSALDNILYVLEVSTFNILKVLKGARSDYYEHFDVTVDGRFLYFTNKRALRVWDWENDRKASALMHVNLLEGAVTLDMRSVITVADDRLIRIWDLGRGLSEGQSTGLDFKEVSVWTPSGGLQARKGDGDDIEDEEDEQRGNRKTMEIRTMVRLSSPRYLLIVSSVREGNQPFLQIYDVAKETFVRRATVKKGMPVAIRHMEGTRVLACVDRRLRVLDVDKMELVRTFQGVVGKLCQKCTHLLNGGKDVVTLTQDSRHLQLYSVSTGEVIATINQTGQKQRPLESLLVNEGRNVAVAETDHNEHVHVFDLKQRQHVHTIIPSDLDRATFTLTQAALTSDGRYLLMSGDKEEKDGVIERDLSGNTIAVFDLEKRQHCRDLVVAETLTPGAGSKVDTNCSSFTVLDNERVLSSHDDNCLRLFSLNSGEMLMRLDGHQSDCNLYRQPSGGQLVLSHGVLSQENAVWLWTVDDLSPVASFRLDVEMEDFLLLDGGHCSPIVANAKGREDPVLFHLRCYDNKALPGNHAPLTSYPELYKGKKLSLSMHIPDLPYVEDVIDTDDDDDEEDDDDNDDGDDDDDDDDDNENEEDEDENVDSGEETPQPSDSGLDESDNDDEEDATGRRRSTRRRRR